MSSSLQNKHNPTPTATPPSQKDQVLNYLKSINYAQDSTDDETHDKDIIDYIVQHKQFNIDVVCDSLSSFVSTNTKSDTKSDTNTTTAKDQGGKEDKEDDEENEATANKITTFLTTLTHPKTKNPNTNTPLTKNDISVITYLSEKKHLPLQLIISTLSAYKSSPHPIRQSRIRRIVSSVVSSDGYDSYLSVIFGTAVVSGVYKGWGWVNGWDYLDTNIDTNTNTNSDDDEYEYSGEFDVYNGVPSYDSSDSKDRDSAAVTVTVATLRNEVEELKEQVRVLISNGYTGASTPKNNNSAYDDDADANNFITPTQTLKPPPTIIPRTLSKHLNTLNVLITTTQSNSNSNTKLTDILNPLNLLALYLNNIVKHPKVGRYRRLNCESKGFLDIQKAFHIDFSNTNTDRGSGSGSDGGDDEVKSPFLEVLVELGFKEDVSASSDFLVYDPLFFEVPIVIAIAIESDGNMKEKERLDYNYEVLTNVLGEIKRLIGLCNGISADTNTTSSALRLKSAQDNDHLDNNNKPNEPPHHPSHQPPISNSSITEPQSPPQTTKRVMSMSYEESKSKSRSPFPRGASASSIFDDVDSSNYFNDDDAVVSSSSSNGNSNGNGNDDTTQTKLPVPVPAKQSSTAAIMPKPNVVIINPKNTNNNHEEGQNNTTPLSFQNLFKNNSPSKISNSIIFNANANANANAQKSTSTSTSSSKINGGNSGSGDGIGQDDNGSGVGVGDASTLFSNINSSTGTSTGSGSGSDYLNPFDSLRRQTESNNNSNSNSSAADETNKKNKAAVVDITSATK